MGTGCPGRGDTSPATANTENGVRRESRWIQIDGLQKMRQALRRDEGIQFSPAA